MVNHTPPGDKIDLEESTLDFPTGKLGAVTRKKNQIKSIWDIESEVQKNEVLELFEEYYLKSATFREACRIQLAKNKLTSEDRDKFLEWQEPHFRDDIEFKAQLESKLITYKETQNKEKAPEDNVSMVSQRSGRSSRSSKSSRSSRSSKSSTASSLRSRLLEKQAKVEASQEFFKQKVKLQEQEAQLARKLEELALSRDKREVDLLQQKLDIAEGLCSKIDGTKLDMEQNKSFKPTNERMTSDRLLSLKEKKILTHSTEGIQIPSQQDIMFQLMRSQQLARLPKTDLSIFDGQDPIKYKAFIIAFDQMVEESCIDDAHKLRLLNTYTSGHAKELVESCIGEDSVAGYQRARKTLKERYGNEYQIVGAYLKKLGSWSPIKSEDGRAMDELSIFLTSCMNLMGQTSQISQLDNPMQIRNIVKLLPYNQRNRWRDKAGTLMELDQPVTFKTLVQFITRQAKLLNLPLYGDIKDDPAAKPKSIASHATKKKSFNTSIKETANATREKEIRKPSLCLFCHKPHSLATCFFFGKKKHEEKIEYIKQKRLCFSCLTEGHLATNCRRRLKCNVCECNKTHPTSLHREQQSRESTPITEHKEAEFREVQGTQVTSGEVVDSREDRKDSVLVASTRSLRSKPNRIVCAAVPVRVRLPGSKNYVHTYLGMDNYCSTCLIAESLLSKLNTRGKDTRITMTTMEKVDSVSNCKLIENLEISSLDGTKCEIVSRLYSKEKWPFTLEDTPQQKDVPSSDVFRNIPFEFPEGKIELLIGVNQPDMIKPLETISNSLGKNQPYATKHFFGWAMNGPVNERTTCEFSCHHIKIEEQEDLEYKIDKYFSLDFLDPKGDENGLSFEDKAWQRLVNARTRQRSDDHIGMELPFRDSNISFPCNDYQAYNRCLGLKKKFSSASSDFEDYKSFMDKSLETGFIERIPEDQIQTLPGQAWYLVHHGVRHKRKGKLRVVFDCSLKCRNISLNDTLLQGPDLTSNLVGVLLRFRQGMIAFMGDIEKMFYQVKVPPKHADFLRFYWFPDGDLNKDPLPHRLTVHVFGAKSSPSCANFALKLTADKARDDISSEAKQAVYKAFYVDDLMKSVEDEDTAITLLKEITCLVSRHKFRLTGFASNSRKLLNSLPAEELSKSLQELNQVDSDLPGERALGVYWNTEEDTLGFKLDLPLQPVTRRGVLSTTFNLYDPLGIVSPVIIAARKVFQKACSLKLPWDEPLPEELKKEWQTWFTTISQLNHYSIPRCY